MIKKKLEPLKKSRTLRNVLENYNNLQWELNNVLRNAPIKPCYRFFCGKGFLTYKRIFSRIRNLDTLVNLMQISVQICIYNCHHDFNYALIRNYLNVSLMSTFF